MIGRVFKSISNQYTVRTDQLDQFLLKPRGSLKYKDTQIKVGDFVEFEDGAITKVLDRKNTFIRPFISNVDYIIIVSSAKRPDLNFELLDKFIINTEMEDVKPILIISKMDLLSLDEAIELKKKLEYYEKYYFVFYSSKNGIEKEEEFRKCLEGKLSIVSGQTGAGKSFLLNLLSPALNLETQEISDALNRGKHTTRHTEILDVAGMYIADSPGFSSLDLSFIKPENLKECFPEFVEVLNECKYNQCQHISEPSCKVKSLVESGNIIRSRYESYVKFHQELMEKDKIREKENKKITKGPRRPSCL